MKQDCSAELPLLTDTFREEGAQLLGLHGALPEEIDRQVTEACGEILRTVRPRAAWRELSLDWEDGGRLYVTGGSELCSRKVRSLVKGCSSAVFWALTLGTEADMLIRRASLTDIGKALVADSCLNAAIEEASGNFTGRLRKEYAAQGLFLTEWCSPGCGDFAIAFQETLLELLDAPRRIGLTCTGEFILTPQKSVTGLMGVNLSPQGGGTGCSGCPKAGKCLSHGGNKDCPVNDGIQEGKGNCFGR